MKRILNIFVLAILTSNLFISCDGFFGDEPIDVKLTDGKPRLVIEALINWEKGTTGNDQTILLSKSSSFFETQDRIPATGATISIENETGSIFTFTENTPGTYTTSNFEPILNMEYTLSITYEGEEIRATETLIPVPEIGEITQDIVEILGEEIPEVTFKIQDTPNEENFYFLEVFPDFQPEKETDFFDDEFTDGNEIEVTFSSEYENPDDEEIREFKIGDVIEISILGISEQFFNYYDIITEQSNPEGGPFSLPPAQANGNCINITNPENRPLGYFRLSEVSRESYTYQ